MFGISIYIYIYPVNNDSEEFTTCTVLYMSTIADAYLSQDSISSATRVFYVYKDHRTTSALERDQENEKK